MRKTYLFTTVAALLLAVTCAFAGQPVAAAGLALTGAFAMTGIAPAMYDLGLGRLRSQLGKLGTSILDANETAFFTRELEAVKARSYDIVYPELKATRLLPVSTDAGPGAETIVYSSFDQVGVAKIIASYADDLPRADVKGREFRAPVRSIGNSYGYNLQEIRAARMAGRPLTQRKANAARRAHDQLVNTIAWTGDDEHGLLGLLNHPNVSRATAPADGAGGGGGQTEFIYKTPDQIIRDLNNLVADMVLLTKGAESPDTLLLPINTWAYLSSTPRSATSETTILAFFLANNPSIRRVEWINEATAAGVDVPGADVAVAYKNSPDKLTLEIPQPFEQLPEQQDNLEFKVPCHSRVGGVIIYYPLSVSILEGI